ncbi:MAG: HEPN domain-containing protein [Desulfurococcales archaeon]|nr:HEPN domain-containing protein [Desulfurococcales archaeon]
MSRYKLDPEWREKADIFLEDAARHLSEGHYWLTCFEAHQDAELYLKPLIVSENL